MERQLRAAYELLNVGATPPFGGNDGMTKGTIFLSRHFDLLERTHEFPAPPCPFQPEMAAPSIHIPSLAIHHPQVYINHTNGFGPPPARKGGGRTF